MRVLDEGVSGESLSVFLLRSSTLTVVLSTILKVISGATQQATEISEPQTLSSLADDMRADGENPIEPKSYWTPKIYFSKDTRYKTNV